MMKLRLQTGIPILSEQPPETEKTNSTNNCGARRANKQEKLGVLENLARNSHLCVPQSVDFGARRVSRERGMRRVSEKTGRGLTLRWTT